MNNLISNYRNAKRFLSECNSVAILNKYRGSALKRCSLARRKLMDEMLRLEVMNNGK